jgi:hypothetical protein
MIFILDKYLNIIVNLKKQSFKLLKITIEKGNLYLYLINSLYHKFIYIFFIIYKLLF